MKNLFLIYTLIVLAAYGAFCISLFYKDWKHQCKKIQELQHADSLKDQINEHNKRINAELLKQNEQLNHRRR